MTVYVSGHITIHDREEYARYEAGFMEVFEQFGGTLMSVDEEPHVLEGTWNATRFVLISFPSHEDAMAWYNSDAYQAIVSHRHAASMMDSVITKGLQ